MRGYIKAGLTTVIFSILLTSLASGVFAATPNNQACLGKDVSGYARNGNSEGFLQFSSGSGFGTTIGSVASSSTGVGSDIQNHLAGNVPDAVILNSCNN